MAGLDSAMAEALRAPAYVIQSQADPAAALH
jgi:hypothetical protein